MRGLFVVLSGLAAIAPSLGETPQAGGRVPGIVIAHSPARTGQYIGSPSIAILPDGGYIASHDLFGPGSTNDATRVYLSGDKGSSWRLLAEIKGQWWSSIFVHRGCLYLIGTSRQDGHTVIRRSSDGGQTWTEPTGSDSGVLLGDGKYHCAPVPVIEHEGRLWRAMEDAMGPGGWGSNFNSFMMSVPAGADLIAVVRTAFDDDEGGAHSQHDANYLTFHRISKFREKLNAIP